MNALAAFRFVACICYLCLALPVMWVLAVLRVTHGPLRARGVAAGRLPLDIIRRLFVQGLLALQGVRIVARGVRGVPACTIYMPNHSSGLDPFIVSASAPLQPAYVFKRELIFMMPPIFALGWLYGDVPIRRSSRESAIGSLHAAAQKVKDFQRSICIFPEGTRSTDGQLLPLKSGPFYLAQEAAVPVTPVIIRNAFELMSKGAVIPSHGGVVTVDYLPPIKVTPNMQHEEIKQLVAKAMQEAQEELKKKPLPKGEGPTALWGLVPISGVVFLLSRFFL